jgi:phosphopantothenoylcysteine decarboxylase / phosphopantothenate---cysteine ligase
MTRSILLIIGGGVAAYKTLELIRLLKGRGIAVKSIMTKAAEHFVTPLSVASLTGEKVYSDLFSLTDETEMGHIELSRAADLLVVAPATADLMAKMASGLASDLASTTLLATDKRVLVAPSMNVRMWHHAATQRNIRTLKNDGILLVGPNEGDMACGEFGLGRMAEPAEILAAVEKALAPPAQPLAGKHVLITAGPTREAIDPVRYISNHSSGKQGYAIAAAASQLGARVTLVSGPVNLPIPPGVDMMPVTTADQMLKAAQSSLPADIAIFAAAVADWKVAKTADEKIKKQGDGSLPSLSFAENPDILKTIATSKQRPKLVVGFAAETENVIRHAKAKLARKDCDLIIANDVSEENNVFGGDANTVHLVSATSVEDWPKLTKAEVAERLMNKLVGML